MEQSKWEPLMRFLCPAFVLFFLLGPTSAFAQSFEGLYRPAGEFGKDWSCNPEFLGSDGGAVGIVNGWLEGVENRCELTDPLAEASDGSVRYTAICSGEGESITEDISIRSTSSGIKITRNGNTIEWESCGVVAGQSSNDQAQSDGTWAFRDGVASITSGGNYLALSCEILNPSATYPVADLSGPCPACFDGDEINFRFSVDGSKGETFAFFKRSNAEGFRSELYYASTWFDGIVVDLMAGQSLTIFEGDSEFASFSLTGAMNALGKLREKCR
jgi:hypothetical protein